METRFQSRMKMNTTKKSHSNSNSKSKTKSPRKTIKTQGWTWANQLDQWRQGIPLTYPKRNKKRFFFETTPCYTRNELYKQKFISSDELEAIQEENYDPFIDYFQHSDNMYVTAFYSLTKKTRLVCPTPISNPNNMNPKHYTTIKDFIDNAPREQQIAFWKRVADEIEWEITKTRKPVYVSTNGLGVSYFHVRIENDPYFYITKSFISK